MPAELLVPACSMWEEVGLRHRASAMPNRPERPAAVRTARVLPGPAAVWRSVARRAGVGLDVFPEEPPLNLDHPLFGHPGFLGSPHVLASTEETEARCYRSMCKDVAAVLRGERPEWCVNPEVFDSPNLRKPEEA